jgi:hypothetical protein
MAHHAASMTWALAVLPTVHISHNDIISFPPGLRHLPGVCPVPPLSSTLPTGEVLRGGLGGKPTTRTEARGSPGYGLERIPVARPSILAS